MILGNGNYYIPSVVNSPLFDSFTIDIKGDTARIFVFLITTSENHSGSAAGYPLISRIKT